MNNQSEYWAGSDNVFQCLMDQRRALAFRDAIRNSVKSGDVVVDVGTGTGIMSFFAAEAGAKKIYAVEADENLYKTLEKNINVNGYQDKIILIKGDATSVQIPEQVDVVICEMIATGLIDELQIPVMNNILRFCKRDTRIIPGAISSYVDLVEINNTFYGHKMQVIQYEYEWDERVRSKPLSEKFLYSKVDFSKTNGLDINMDIPIEITIGGEINGVRITNETLFPDGSVFQDSAAYCMPLILPIESIAVTKGDMFSLHLEYKMCNGINKLQFSLESKKMAI